MITGVNGVATEFSATGRIGVSLAEIAAVREVGFAFARATSRLHEMSGVAFGRSRKAEWAQWTGAGTDGEKR